jgi:tRNA (Thr-GGU) A37 N-methylase
MNVKSSVINKGWWLTFSRDITNRVKRHLAKHKKANSTFFSKRITGRPNFLSILIFTLLNVLCKSFVPIRRRLACSSKEK